METASCVPGLRRELGATTGAITVGSVSELVLWGPTKEPSLLRGVWSRTPTRGLGCPSRGTSQFSLPASVWSPAASGAVLDTFGGEFQGHCRSRSRDEGGVTRVEGSCCSVSRSEGSLLRAERGHVDLGPAAAWEYAPTLCFCRRWYSTRLVAQGAP